MRVGVGGFRVSFKRVGCFDSWDVVVVVVLGFGEVGFVDDLVVLEGFGCAGVSSGVSSVVVFVSSLRLLMVLIGLVANGSSVAELWETGTSSVFGSTLILRFLDDLVVEAGAGTGGATVLGVSTTGILLSALPI